VATNTKQRGSSIRIFLVDGTPDGVRTVDKSNWTGRGIVCPRSRFPDAKSRKEISNTGYTSLSARPVSRETDRRCISVNATPLVKK